MQPQPQHRDFRFEIKSAPDEKGFFSGYGSVFGVVDSYRERVVKGAFAKSLAKHVSEGTMPLMFYGHSPAHEIGEWLEMREDDHGLFVAGRLWVDGDRPDADALKAYRGMTKSRGKMGLSIGYTVPQGGATLNPADKVAELIEIDLMEVSPVAFPANPQARVEHVRARINTIRDYERLLRDAGFSRSEATGLAAHGFKVLSLRGDHDDELLERVRGLINTIKKGV